MHTDREDALTDAREIVWKLYSDCRRDNRMGAAQVLLHTYYYLKCQLGIWVPMYERIVYGAEEEVRQRVKESGESDREDYGRIPRYNKGQAGH